MTNSSRQITIGPNNTYTALFSPTTAVETLTFSNFSRVAPAGMPAVFVDGEFVPGPGTVSRLDAATVSMLTTFPNGSIFYTLDGSEPDFAGGLYDGPFILRQPALLRAVAYDASFLTWWEADPVRVILEPTYAVNATTTGGGAVGVSPVRASYQSNTVVTLTATPAPGWVFLHWLGDVAGPGAVATVRVSVRNVCAQAVFGTTLGTTVAGGGVVEVEPAAVYFAYGTVARLTAAPPAGSFFAAWGNAVMSTNNPLLFPVTNASPVVSCAFGTLSAGQAALTARVSGRGRVTTNPRGNRFAVNQSVTLTATADAGQEFLGWSGDATGAGTNVTVTLAQSRVITANFTKRSRLEVFTCGGAVDTANLPLLLHGEAGEVEVIEGSADLWEWSALATVTNAFGTAQWNDTGGAGWRFYRARPGS